MAENMCAMSTACEGKEAYRGLMCREHREEDRAIERRISDDVDPAAREPKDEQ
jgi:hypothetical protein